MESHCQFGHLKLQESNHFLGQRSWSSVWQQNPQEPFSGVRQYCARSSSASRATHHLPGPYRIDNAVQTVGNIVETVEKVAEELTSLQKTWPMIFHGES